MRLHAVIGGDGPPLLLVHGWPETWYAWRLVMPALARDFEVIAVDQRGMGLSDKPAGGYDTGTLAGDLVALMDALGHERFAVVGHDTGFAISYALAADHPDRVERAALAEIPGSPGAAPSPPVFVPGPINDRLWHLPFNRVERLNEQLVTGREASSSAGSSTQPAGSCPDESIDYYVGGLSDPDVAARQLRVLPGARRDASRRTRQRKTRRLPMPVLAIGGASSFGEHVGEAMQLVADDVQSVVIPGTGHFLAEEAPDELLAALTPFLAAVPRRNDRGRASRRSPRSLGRDRQSGPPVVPVVGVDRASRPLRGPRVASDVRRDRPRRARSPALDGAPVWLNSEPLTAEGLRGRVVLVDFWTYSCVNWLRTLPYVSAWHERYRDRGLVVVGAHAPEFGFEHDLGNVRRAVGRAGRRLPGRDRQRLRHLALVREPLLAGRLPRRP